MSEEVDHLALLMDGKRPTNPASSDLERHREIKAGTTVLGAAQGVSVYWLSTVFRMSQQAVRRRLADCPPMKGGRGGSLLYDIREAAAYLVEPKLDMERFLSQMNASDLPPTLQKEVWDAKLKRQTFEERAKDLWRTEDVMATYADTFATIKTTVQLWPDEVERAKGLTNEQRTEMVRLSDLLLDAIYESLCKQAQDKRTPSSIEEKDV